MVWFVLGGHRRLSQGADAWMDPLGMSETAQEHISSRHVPSAHGLAHVCRTCVTLVNITLEAGHQLVGSVYVMEMGSYDGPVFVVVAVFQAAGC